MTEKSNHTITVRDEDGYFSITVDRGFGPRLAATVPTGNRAAYSEAIERNMAEARGKVTAIVDDQVRICPDAVVVGWGEIAEEPAEVRIVPFIAHDLANIATGEIWAASGTAPAQDGSATTAYYGVYSTVWYGDDKRGFSPLPLSDLMHPATAAVCVDGYTVADSCPGCDARNERWAERILSDGVAVTDVRPGEQPIRIGTILDSVTGAWFAMTDDEQVIGYGIIDADSAIRALRLDHKRRSHAFALLGNTALDKTRG